MRRTIPHTDMATENFLYAFRVIKLNRPVVKKVEIKTDRDICNLLSMPQSSISAMDKGARSVTLEQCAALCFIFGFSMEWMVFSTGDMEIDNDLQKIRKAKNKKK